MRTTPLLLLPLVLAACGSSEEPAAPSGNGGSTELTADVEGGKAYYNQTCIPCHGALGGGDGDAAASLDPKPRDLSDAAWQDSVDDDYLRKIIQYGGAAVGKAATMPANPLLGSQPEVLEGVIQFVRSLEK